MKMPSICLTVVVSVIIMIGLVGGAVAGDFNGFPKISPLYPPPPYQITNSEHLMIVFEFDEASVRELLPPGLEPASGNTALLNMYRAHNAVGLGPYTATYITVDVKGFDSADGTKGRFMIHGWYGPDRVTAALREVMGLPVKLGTTTVERRENSLRAVLSRDGAPVIEAAIAVNGKSLGVVGGVLNYPVLREVPAWHGTQTQSSELIVHRIPYTGELIPADPVSVEFGVPDKDPIRKLQPKKLLSAFYFKGDAFAFGYADVIGGNR